MPLTRATVGATITAANYNALIDLIEKPDHLILSRNSTAYSVPNNADTQLTSTYLDTAEQSGATTSGGAITIATSGLYEVAATATFLNNATGTRVVRVNRNSTTATTNPLLYASVFPGASALTTVAARKVVRLTIGDVLRFFVFQNSGGTLALPNAADILPGTFFAARWVAL